MKEYWVEYEFEKTAYGERPNLIRCFKTKEAAEAFNATIVGGKVVELTPLHQ